MFYKFKQYLTRQESNRTRLGFEQGLSPQGSSLNLRLSIAAFGFLAMIVGWQSARAQTFVDASTKALQQICSVNNGDAFQDINGVPFVPNVGSQLEKICRGIAQGQNGQPASSGVGTQSQPNSILISQQQLKDEQTKKETEGRHGSADVVAANWGRFSTFLTAGATTLHHRNNEFEQGYTATIPSVTLGGGYLISNNLETGLAFNYSNSNGDNNTGGGFNVDSYSPLLYINYLPFDHAFANLALGYTRQNQANNRIAVASKDPSSFCEPSPDPDCDDTISLRRSTRGNLNANQYSLNFLGGYDHPVENLTIGPRFGVDVRQWEMNGYQESTNTGLELRYNSQNQTSIQSTLGLAASSVHRFTSGVLVPQLSASWVHEYSNNSRTINAKFVQAPDSNEFSFQTENPARNWAVINLGVSFLMQQGVQVFANLSTVQGNRNFESYGGNVGVRVGW